MSATNLYALQFHLLPTRDWNAFFKLWFWAYLELQFHLLPTRDWNFFLTRCSIIELYCNFTYSLLGIETVQQSFLEIQIVELQFHLLPTRDWNATGLRYCSGNLPYCNFTYSLLGIETCSGHEWTRDLRYCNFTYSLLGIETNTILQITLNFKWLQFHLLPTRDWNL